MNHYFLILNIRATQITKSSSFLLLLISMLIFIMWTNILSFNFFKTLNAIIIQITLIGLKNIKNTLFWIILYILIHIFLWFVVNLRNYWIQFLKHLFLIICLLFIKYYVSLVRLLSFKYPVVKNSFIFYLSLFF